MLPTQGREIMGDVIFCFYLMCFHNLQEPQQTGIHYVCHAALSTHLHEWPWSEGAFLTLKCRIFCIFFFLLCSPQMIWHHIREKDDTSHGCCRVQSNLCDKMETVGGDSWEHRSRALWQGWGRERGRSPSHHHLSALQDFSPFLEQLIDHLLYWDHLRHRMKINVSCTWHSRQLWTRGGSPRWLSISNSPPYLFRLAGSIPRHIGWRANGVGTSSTPLNSPCTCQRQLEAAAGS